MPITRFKRYLNNESAEDTHRDALSLIVKKMGECAVDVDPEESQNFRAELRAIHEVLAPDLPRESMLILIESAIQVLEAYNNRITRKIGQQTRELQTIIRMLHHSLIGMSGETTRYVQGLERIGQELDRGPGFRNLTSLKLDLGKCLSGLREEFERERTASKSMMEKLQIEIESFRRAEGGPAPRSADAGTGLPSQEDCIAAMKKAIERGTRHYAVVMVVNRVEPIVARFGRDAGNWMLSQFRKHIQTQLPLDRLFHWSGSAMVAILERPLAFDQVHALIRRMVSAQIQDTYLVSGRSVLIPIAAAWTIFMLASTPEVTERQIRTFIAGQNCRDFA
jgi:GGDEF domain-containing protein